MVLEHTPVKRLLAEQLAVPSPRLSRFLLSLLFTLNLPLWGISPHVCGEFVFPGSCLSLGWGGERAPCDTRAVCVFDFRASIPLLCARPGWLTSLFSSLLRPVDCHQLCFPHRPQSRWSHPLINVYTSCTTANKEWIQFSLFFTRVGDRCWQSHKMPKYRLNQTI